ncbi:MAG: TonB-dependent receptor [Bryobacteraceae bacterium]
MPLDRIAALLLAALGLAGQAAAQVAWTGRVTDQNDAPVAGARVRIRQEARAALEAESSPTGSFVITVPAPGRYLVTVDRAGYFQLRDQAVEIAAGGAETTLVLNVQEEVFQSVHVGALSNPVDATATASEERLSGTDINNIPYPATESLRNGMRLMPGTIEDPSAGLHFHGGAEYQTGYTLNGVDITDPIGGRYATLLALDGVQSVELEGAREPAQFGPGSGGTLAIRTENGTDLFHYTVTNFIPGIDQRGGVRVGDWAPRAVLSGPIVKGTAWFADSVNGSFNNGYVAGLPPGADTNAAWGVGNLAHAQVNLTPANIVYADFLSNFDHQSHFGLGPLDPYPTSSGLSDREYLLTAKDSHSWYGGSLLEVGIAWQAVYHRQVPEGTAPYLITPEGRSGNYYVDSRRNGSRGQVFVNYFPRARAFAGRHQLQTGAAAQRLGYDARFARSEAEVVGLSGLPLFVTTFRGGGAFDRRNSVASAYVGDHWQPGGRFTVDAGARLDWDGLVGEAAVSPRIAAAWAPMEDGRTKLTVGYAVLRDPSNLALFSRPLDQQAVITPYDSSGAPLAPLVTTFLPGRDLKFPRYGQWSAGGARDLGRHISASAEWMRKRGDHGFVYAPAGAPGEVNLDLVSMAWGTGGDYVLSNLRRDAYDEGTIAVRQSFGEQFGWMASYTRSRAVSNAVLSTTIDQPLQVMGGFAPMPWDAPNRFLGWGYFPLHGPNWALAMLVDYRTGLPYSITTDSGALVGPMDAERYPGTFDLNVHVERRFVFHGYRLGLRVGCNNVTGHRNYTAVNSVAGAPGFQQFYGAEGRRFVVRIRLFGRARKP